MNDGMSQPQSREQKSGWRKSGNAVHDEEAEMPAQVRIAVERKYLICAGSVHKPRNVKH